MTRTTDSQTTTRTTDPQTTTRTTDPQTTTRTPDPHPWRPTRRRLTETLLTAG